MRNYADINDLLYEDPYIIEIVKNILYEKAVLKQKENKELILLFEANILNENLLLEMGEMDFLTQGGGAGSGKGILGKFKAEMMGAYGADPFSIVDYGNLFASTALKSGTAFMGIFGRPLFGLIGGQGGLRLYKGMESKWNSAISSQFPETLTTSNKDFINQAMPALLLSNPFLAVAAGLTMTLIDKNGNPFPISVGGGSRGSGSLGKLLNVFSGNTLQEYLNSINRKVLPGLRKLDDNVDNATDLKKNLSKKLNEIASNTTKISKIQSDINKTVKVSKHMGLKSHELLHFMTILRMVKDGRIPNTEAVATKFELSANSFKILDKNEVSSFFSDLANIVSSFSYDNIDKNKLSMYKAAALSLVNADRKKTLGGKSELGPPVRTFKSGRKIEYSKEQLIEMFNEAEGIIKKTTQAQLDELIKNYSPSSKQ